MKINWHALDITPVIKELETSKNGLSKDEALKRLQIYGLNQLPQALKLNIIKILLNQFRSVLVIILIIALSLSLLLGEYIDAFIVLIIVVLNTVIGVWQEYKAEKAIESLSRVSASKSLVLREGHQLLIDSAELVPGDVLLVNAGDKIGADARIIEVADLKVNESILTGESAVESKVIDILNEDIVIADRRNMLYAGTTVEEGRARAVVVSTGQTTELGKIADLVHTEKKELTPLQKRLDQLTAYITRFTLILILPTILLSIYRGGELVHIFELAMSLAVSAVPEGLAVIVTITLAFGVKKMLKNNVLVRKLPIAEVLGSTDVICTDKTGTLTTNRMTATEFYSFNKHFDLLKAYSKNTAEKVLLIKIFENFVLASDADTQGGDPTEIALVCRAQSLGIDINRLRTAHKRNSEIPFSSEYKYMAVLLEDNTIVAKGATENILEICTHYYKDNEIKPLDSKIRFLFLELNKKLAGDGGRVLGLAYKPNSSINKLDKSKLKDLVFKGLVVLKDPPREEARDAVIAFQKAGIRVIMITGDHALTAKSIAAKVNIKSDETLTGTELDKFDDNELVNKVEKISIYARVNSEHKLRILKALQRNGHIVAMGGDGVNDAPALKKADIGFSLGTGSELAKEVSDMILLDDSFANLPKAIREGRIIFRNLRNYFKLLLSSNFDEILLITTSIIVEAPLPLLPIQILWINLLSDGLPALALSSDRGDKDVMRHQPNSKNDALFKGIFQFVIVAGTIAFIMAFSLFSYIYPWWNDSNLDDVSLDKARTMVFSAAVLYEMFLVFICRSKKFAFGSYAFSNLKLLFSVAISIILLLFAIYLPFLNNIFNTISLTFLELTTVLIFVVIAASLLECFKLLYYGDKDF